MKLIIFVILSLFPVFSQRQDVKSFKQLEDLIDVTLSEGTLRIYPLTDNTMRIKFFKNVETRVPELVFTSSISTPKFQVTDTDLKLEIKVKNIIVQLNKQTSKLSFADNTGKIFLSEKADSRKLIPDSVMGEPCFFTEQSFESPNDEYIFGLGQFQDGHYNLKNISRRLTQVNSQISLPFIYSNKGYGLLWHQYGLTDFNPADNFVTLEKQDQSTAGNNHIAEVTTTSGTQKVSQDQSLYTGKFIVPEDEIYSIFLDLGDMDNRQYVVIDGKPIIDVTNFWLPPTANELQELKAGEHQVQLVCKSSNTPKLSWKLTGDETTFRSPNAKLLDYVVFFGPSADNIISTYRKLSGDVPMLPRWAYGFWQCRERYTSGTNLVETVKEFRKRNLPMDVIVQDWQYWGNNGWGVPMFDDTNYPNPASFIKEIHDLNAHFNISIWSNPDKNSEIGNQYVAKNRYIPNSKWLDYFNPETRKEYWNTLKENLFTHGIDSWWMDATEPENDGLHGKKTYLGLGDFYRLTYPLFVSQAVYEGQRKTTSEKRVCILTRSAFLGQQRYGTINWSGDICGTWDSYRRQIVAGLNYTVTGMPYWTTDIGGFFRPGQSQYTDEKYQELLIRWFQWGAFNPIFRIHGYQSETEPWKYGQQIEDKMRKILNLRYRLLPFIYSEAWQITKNGSTMMRPLVMDFNGDTDALNQQYEYMFGKSFLVAPVTEPNVNDWSVYLPKSASWYDFWTGEKHSGGQTLNKETPIDIIPLFVRAGSIIPIGPKAQYATEKNWDNLEIRIYPGADGEFTLYEDENDNYNYEKDAHSTITFKWNDAKKELTISDIRGAFPGILIDHKFNIVIVSQNNGIGIDTFEKYDKVVTYNGKKIEVTL
jgi:alpha-D-xyloside xylohydrolase